MNKIQLETKPSIFGGSLMSTACFFSPFILVGMTIAHKTTGVAVAGAFMSECWNS